MRTCRECDRQESDAIPFKKNGNICLDCNKVYMTNYRAKNREKLSIQISTWKNINREHYRKKNREHHATESGKAKHIARVQKTPRTWIGHIFSMVKRKVSNPGRHDKKDGPGRMLTIDIDYVMDLYKNQDGKCAVTGLFMTTKFNDHFAISIDRIDSDFGYIPGNVQLVCQAVNFAKRHHSNDSIRGFFEEFARLRVSGSQCRCTMGRHDSEEVQCPIHWSEAIRSRVVN